MYSMENSIQKHSNSNKINTLYSYDTVLCSDSIEWCPHEPCQNSFVCANYQLSDDKNIHNNGVVQTLRERVGRIVLFTISPDEGLKLRQQLKTAAVLDQKWCHTQINGYSLLGVANAAKTIEIYKLHVAPDSDIKLILLTSFTIASCEVETLILSLDWSTGVYDSYTPYIVCSDSKGNIHKLRLEDSALSSIESWHAHEYEAWISAFYYWDISVVFTGGDDSVLLKFDGRVGREPVAKNKSHEAGVTTIHCSMKEEFLITTGSYDSTLRLWDARNMKKSRNELKVPGTLWRVKWDPFECHFLLAACMLGGVHVVNAKEDLRIVESYYEHRNLAYGVDWCHLKRDDVEKFKFGGNRIIGSCSFYDHLLCISKLYCESKV